MSRGQQPGALRAALSWLPVCAYTGLIWFLSSHALEFHLLDRFPLRDKGVHFVEYGALAFLIAHAMHVTWPDARHGFAAALWLTVGLGLTDELHQAYVPGRTAETLDLLADTLGGLCAISLHVALRGWRKRRRQSPIVRASAQVEARGAAREKSVVNEESP